MAIHKNTNAYLTLSCPGISHVSSFPLPHIRKSTDNSYCMISMQLGRKKKKKKKESKKEKTLKLSRQPILSTLQQLSSKETFLELVKN